MGSKWDTQCESSLWAKLNCNCALVGYSSHGWIPFVI